MANIIDYIKWRGDVAFTESPFNEVDALIFSELSYVHFDDLVTGSLGAKGVPLSTLAEKFYSLHYDKSYTGAIIPVELILELFKAAAESVRFSTVTVKGFVNEIDLKAQKQFCAMCFDITKDATVVAFRGTDDTIIGWKEDINMAFFTPIPAQKQGAEYLSSVISRSNKSKYYVCGHSKGGNVATYAALKTPISLQKKIEGVYCFDGPGFMESYCNTVKNSRMLQKTYKFMPEGTIIGAIFDSVENCSFVKSTAKGLYQHDGFTWEVLGKELVRAEKQSKSSLEFHNLRDNVVVNMTDKEKKDFSDALYTFFTVNESVTLTDIVSDKFKFLVGILKTDDKTKKTVFSTLNRFIKEKYFKRSSKDKKNKQQ